jgi:Fe-S-cluster containining protein
VTVDDEELALLASGVADNVERAEQLTRAVRRLGTMLARMAQVEAPPTPPAIVLAEVADKHQVASAEVDCAARMHLCHGRCCGFDVALSRQDLEEDRLRFRIDRPYWLAQGDDGYCVYQARDSGGCGVHARRPAACRSYSCRDDPRVWIDFERMIPAPMPTGMVQIRRRTP